MDEFLIEKYIEINNGISVSISINIMYADPDPHSYSVTIYSRGHYQKAHVALVEGNKRQQWKSTYNPFVSRPCNSKQNLYSRAQ